MAITVSSVAQPNVGNLQREIDAWGARPIGLYRVTLDSSYPTNGYAFDPQALAIAAFPVPVAAVFITPRLGATGAQQGNTFVYDPSAKKIKVFTTSATELGNGSSLATVVLDVLVIGS